MPKDKRNEGKKASRKQQQPNQTGNLFETGEELTQGRQQQYQQYQRKQDKQQGQDKQS
ncbi:MAG: hypothetical protein GX195_12870 [Firmicutes bacterium]|nr:hypothetical protein [Bacillota bacterium]